MRNINGIFVVASLLTLYGFAVLDPSSALYSWVIPAYVVAFLITRSLTRHHTRRLSTQHLSKSATRNPQPKTRERKRKPSPLTCR
jgi:hypothetical protein